MESDNLLQNNFKNGIVTQNGDSDKKLGQQCQFRKSKDTAHIMDADGRSYSTSTVNNSDQKSDKRKFSIDINWRREIKEKLPIISWLPHYTINFLIHDILAGFTVGLTEIPQGMAYAAIAGLPSQYGLYSGIMGCFIYCIFGTLKDVNIGPASILSLMIQPHVAVMGAEAAILLCFLSGCIIFLLGLFKLGFLVQMFSYPVIAGFTSAAALNIGSSQVKSLFGIPGKSESFLGTWVTVFKSFDQMKAADSALGVLTIVFLIFLRELKRLENLKTVKSNPLLGKMLVIISLSRNVFAVVIGTILAYIMKDDGPFELTGDVQQGLPPWSLPPFSASFNNQNFTFEQIMDEFGTTIIFCPIVAMLETFATAKVFSQGTILDGSQEMISLGLANIFGGFISSMPVAGSLTRTAINNTSGVKTTAGGIITGAMILLALSFMTSIFYYIPKATLAAVVICAVIYLVDVEAFVVLWKTKKLDLAVFIVTFLVCVLYNLQYGILIGIAINMSFVIYSMARPKIEVKLLTVPDKNVYLVTPKISLHFPAAEHMRETILKKCILSESIVILNAKYIGNMDATVAKTMVSLANEFKFRNQEIIFWRFKNSVIDICLGMNKDLKQYFKAGDLKQIIKDLSADQQHTINIEHSIQS